MQPTTMSPRHVASYGCGKAGWPLDLKDSFEYMGLAVWNPDRGWFSSVGFE